MEVRDLFETLEYGPAPESPDMARLWLQKRENMLDHFIGGEWVVPGSGEYFESRNPSNGELLAMVADGNATDVSYSAQHRHPAG